MKNKLKRLWISALSLSLLSSMVGETVVFASETYTSDVYNHGTIALTAGKSDGVINTNVGNTVRIGVSPYQHVQYKGCMTTPKCPDVCGSDLDCFIPDKGCKCDTTPLLRTTKFTVTSSDPNVVAEGTKAADAVIGASVGDKNDGALYLNAVGEGVATVTVSASMRDWVSAEKTYTVNVGSAVNAGSEEIKPAVAVAVGDMNAWTTYVRTADDASQTLHVELIFNEELSVLDEAALQKEVNEWVANGVKEEPSEEIGTIQFGSGLGNAVTTAVLQADRKTLLIETTGWGAQIAGIFVAKGEWKNLVTSDGRHAVSDIRMVIPNGLYTEIVSQKIATASQKASVTTRIVQPEGCTRGMVHLIVLKNGQPVAGTTGLNQYGATCTAHFHDFLNMSAADFIGKSAKGALETALENMYTIDYDEGSDTFTLTAVQSEPGDIIEFHLYSYINNGTKNVDLTSLNAAISKAGEISADEYTKASYTVFSDALAKAEMIAKDGTYYAQSDIDTATENLAKAQEALERQGNSSQSAVLKKSMFTVNTNAKAYTGKAITTTVRSSLKKNVDYTVTYKNNKKIGVATVKISGKGNYQGNLSYHFKIKLAKAKITKKNAAKKKAVLAWSDSGAKSYQIYYRVKGASEWKIKNVGAKTKATLISLTTGKRYQVKIKSVYNKKTSTFSKTALLSKIK